jgi:hypothetical protein
MGKVYPMGLAHGMNAVLFFCFRRDPRILDPSLKELGKVYPLWISPGGSTEKRTGIATYPIETSNFKVVHLRWQNKQIV